MNANERPRLLQAMALVDEGGWAIDGPAARGIAPGIDVSRAPNGRLYPNKPPGTTAAAVAAYVLMRARERVGGPTPTLQGYTRLARGFAGALPLVLVLVLAVRRWGAGKAVRFALVVYTLATPALAYSRLLYGHQLAAGALFAGVLGLEHAMRTRSPRWALASGALASSAVCVEYLAAFAGLPVAIWLLWACRKSRSPRVWMAALAGALVPAAALAGYHQLVFENPWVTPYHFVEHERFAEIHQRGLLGLTWPTHDSLFEHLVSPWGGLFYWVPMCVPAVAASAIAMRTRGAGALEVVASAIFCLFVALNLCLAQTGGWRVGPRYLVVALPMLLPGWIRVHGWMGSRWRAGLTVAVLGWSIVVNFLAAGLFPHLVPRGNPLMDVLLPLWVEGLRPHSMWEAVGLGAPALGLSAVGTMFAFAWAAGPTHPRARIGWWLGVLGACALVAAAAAWPGAEDRESTLASIRRIWEPNTDRPAPPPRFLEPLPLAGGAQ